MSRRISLALSHPKGVNTFILDELTNNPDLASLTALNNGLIAFPEVLLLASRDHELVSCPHYGEPDRGDHPRRGDRPGDGV
jgi:ATPase subunit of ABC transporter with duplicated ATPase domains